jgi:uncharacterized protein YdhG (YjbR/CyaY superfamily)
MREFTPKNVDEYLMGYPEKVQVALEKVRTAIKTAVPKAEEKISYQIPTYKLNGFLVGFGAFKNHCSFFAMSYRVIKQFHAELAPFETSGTTIHFHPEKPLPATLIRKLVKARILENEMRVKKKTAKSRKT